VLALALQFQEMIDSGEVRDYADLARLGCVSRERISQIMMLVWLAPDIQEEVLRLPPSAGRAPFSEGALRRIAKIVRWDGAKAGVATAYGLPGTTRRFPQPCTGWNLSSRKFARGSSRWPVTSFARSSP
jgi:hypothetical protein